MSSGELWQAAVLGVVQGLTEFLPISSSAHLLIVPWLLRWQPMGLAFDVAVHLGTLLAVLVYFRRDWIDLAARLTSAVRGMDNSAGHNRLIWAIAAGTVPAVLVGALGSEIIEVHLRTPLVTVATLSLFGILLWGSDRWGRKTRLIGSIGVGEGLLVGLAQAVALAPGVSRSGVTITVALMLGFTRAHAARFSFLLAAPVIALAAMKDVFDALGKPLTGLEGSLHFFVGIIVSFISGFLCIKYFLRFLATRSYFAFVVYRLLLACFILVWLTR